MILNKNFTLKAFIYFRAIYIKKLFLAKRADQFKIRMPEFVIATKTAGTLRALYPEYSFHEKLPP
jgi:hypothetical protein